MKWSDFYENHLDWDDDVVVKNIDKLQNLGPGNEIAEIYGDFQDEAAEKLLKKAMKTGVVFEPEDVLEIINWTEEEMTCRLLAYQLNKRGEIPFDYLIEYAEFVPDSFFESLLIDTAKKGAKYNSDQLDKLGEYADEKTLLEVIRLTDMHLAKKDFDKLERTIDIEELYKIDEKQETHAYGPEPWEITDAINAADYAISCLVNAANYLANAGNWGIAGLLSRHRIFSVLKHAELADASGEIREASNALGVFGRDIKNMRGAFSADIGNFLRFVDLFTDSFVADCLVQRKIDKSYKRCKSAIRQVEDIRNDLVAMLKTLKVSMEGDGE